MDAKILLNIMLPATGRSYDFEVPQQLTVHAASHLVASVLAQREPERYTDKGDIGLMDRHTGNILNPRLAIKDADLVNGAQLTLV